ncbi:MAG: hypothetical protein K0R05_1359 [Anaerocolumna sp.]|jgi:hypothetical protein|nr:hypothetical protein [Anaerocolumna sp.]
MDRELLEGINPVSTLRESFAITGVGYALAAVI